MSEKAGIQPAKVIRGELGLGELVAAPLVPPAQKMTILATRAKSRLLYYYYCPTISYSYSRVVWRLRSDGDHVHLP